MKIDSKILICYNSPVSIFPIYNGKPSQKGKQQNDLSESGIIKEISLIKNSLKERFSNVETFAVDRNVERTIKKISKISPHIIFNFIESIDGVASYEYCMAGVYQLLGINFTGNTPPCLGNCLNKTKTKLILKSFNINTPDSLTLDKKDIIKEGNFNLKYPLILKPAREDASIGISEFSVVNNFIELKKQLAFLRRTYNQEVIVEEYIDGRELNVAVLGDMILPISEIQFNGLPVHFPKIVTYEGKWIADSIYYNNTKPKCPTVIDASTKRKVEKIALLTFQAMDCRDYARIDIRLTKNKVPFVIEVNPNPDISMDSGFVRAANAGGISYSEMLYKIATFALERKNHDSQCKAS